MGFVQCFCYDAIIENEKLDKVHNFDKITYDQYIDLALEIIML